MAKDKGKKEKKKPKKIVKKQQGFTAVEGILILIIVGLVGFTGWFVYNTKNTSDKTAKTASEVSNSPAAKTPAADPTANWISFSSAEGKFSLKYPTSWSKESEGCSDNLVLLGGDANSVGKCATEGFGQMAVSSAEGDERDSYKFDEKNGYKAITTEDVKVNGVSGIKQTATAEGQENIVLVGALPDGAKVTSYVFYTGGRTYHAQYIQQPAYKNVMSDFELMVTKTLKFQA